MVVMIIGMVLVTVYTSSAQERRGGVDFITKFDKNGDGKVSRKEFPALESAFNFFDKNRDGFITLNEAPQGQRQDHRRLEKGKTERPKLDKSAEDFLSETTITGIPKKVEMSRNVSSSFFWGTEGRVEINDVTQITKKTAQIVKTIKKTLKTKYVKFRLSQWMVMKNGAFTPEARGMMGKKYNLDEIAKLFKQNGWSMIPMLTHDLRIRSNITTADIGTYVSFVDWFVGRYKDQANIKYLELINGPQVTWRGTSNQLLEVQNRVYQRIKSKYPEILVGTPGFEFARLEKKSVEMINLFLDKSNGAKFDFFAFHGYRAAVYSPKKDVQFAGLSGILELRKRLNENGWQRRLLIDTEHVGILRSKKFPGGMIPEETDRHAAIWLAQALIVKRSLAVDGKPALSGIVSLNIWPRGDRRGDKWGSLNSDGSLTAVAKAAGAIFEKFNPQVQHIAHLSGKFDNPNQVWMEEFRTESKEILAFFKPLENFAGLDDKVLKLSVSLNQKPLSAVLTDIFGNTEKLRPTKNFTFEVTNTPQFLELSFGSNG
jgi:hypothetical protein